MSVPPIWPTTILPLPLIALKGAKKSTVIATEFESGDLRQRRRFSVDKRMVNLELILSFAQLGYFESWVEHYIDGGASKFMILFPDPATETNELATGQMVAGVYDHEQLAGNDTWKVSFQMLLDFNPVISKVILDRLIAGLPATPPTDGIIYGGLYLTYQIQYATFTP